jgi:hypothetical protein
MPSLDRILHADLMRITIPRILLKGLLGYALAAVLLAVIVPPLHRRGIPLQRWLAWSTIALMIAICVAPEVYRRRRRRVES